MKQCHFSQGALQFTRRTLATESWNVLHFIHLTGLNNLFSESHLLTSEADQFQEQYFAFLVVFISRNLFLKIYLVVCILTPSSGYKQRLCFCKNRDGWPWDNSGPFVGRETHAYITQGERYLGTKTANA